MGFALTQANEIVFDTLSTSRKAVNLARNPKAALVIGWDDQRFPSDRRRRPPAGRRRPGERQGGLFPRMAGRPRPRELAGHRLCRREAEMDTIFQLRRWSAGRRGVQALAAGSSATRVSSPPVALTAFGVYTRAARAYADWFRRVSSRSDMIHVTFPDGASAPIEPGVSGLDIAKSISPSLAKRTVAMVRDGELVDLADPIDARRDARVHRARRSARARADPPRRGACARRGGAVALARTRR